MADDGDGGGCVETEAWGLARGDAVALHALLRERHSRRDALPGRPGRAPAASQNVSSGQRFVSGHPPPAMQLQTQKPAGCTSAVKN